VKPDSAGLLHRRDEGGTLGLEPAEWISCDRGGHLWMPPGRVTVDDPHGALVGMLVGRLGEGQPATERSGQGRVQVLAGVLGGGAVAGIDPQ
jgi:hypothetical protein